MTNENSLDGAKLNIVGEGKSIFNYTTIIDKRLSLPNLPPNTYTITITKDGFEDYIKTVTIGKYDHISLNVDLTPKQANKTKNNKTKNNKTNGSKSTKNKKTTNDKEEEKKENKK